MTVTRSLNGQAIQADKSYKVARWWVSSAQLEREPVWDVVEQYLKEEVKEKQLWPTGFLPRPYHEAGGMIFPKFLIKETKKQTDRYLTRFDLDIGLLCREKSWPRITAGYPRAQLDAFANGQRINAMMAPVAQAPSRVALDFAAIAATNV